MRHHDIDRRRFLGLAGAAAGAGALALTGCGNVAPRASTGAPLAASGYDGPPVTLDYWTGFTGGDGPTMRALVQQFNDSQDAITVEMNTIQWAQYYQRLAAAVHAGKGPDVGAMQVDQLATQVKRRTLAPLDDVLGELGVEADQYPPEVWDRGEVDGKRYGVPLDVHSLTVYSNRGLLDGAGLGAIPGTGEAYEQWLTEAARGGVDQPFWMPNRWPAHLMFLSLLWQNGGDPYAADGSRATFDDDAGVAALTWMRDQVTRGFSPANVAVDSQYTAFKDGRGAVTWDGIWQINDLRDTAPDLDWTMSALPTVGAEPAVWASSHQLVLCTQRDPDPNRIEAGKAFLRFLSQNSAGWAGAGMIPAAAAARQEQAFLDSPQAAIAAAVPTMRFLPAVPALGDVQAQTLEIAVSDAVLGRTPPAEALAGAARTATSLMRANLEKFGR